MGGAVSAGADNDELIDNLLEAEYIKTATVERVFRAVDRGHYFTVECKERAYRDIAWKCGNLHISAPCIYSKVMESLKLAPGLSFLNLGSGTGYLSTMAGLILGPYGVNHGIEIHEDVINYATKKLKEFMSSSNALDAYEFCEPKFVCGNGLHIGTGAIRYDRVYCSAACPDNQENYMKRLLKVGGILVIPINDQLYQICRKSESYWESKAVLPVSFATLVSSQDPEIDPVKLPELNPLPLQDICRFVVRTILREIINKEHPELTKSHKLPKKKGKKRTIGQLVMPIFHSNSDEEDSIVGIPANASVLGWSQILRGPTRATILARCGSDRSGSNSGTQSDQETAMEEDLNVDVENAANNFFHDISESDIDELNSMLPSTDHSTTTSGSDSEGKTPSVKVKAKKSKTRVKTKSKRVKEEGSSGVVKELVIETNGSDSEEEKSRKPTSPFPIALTTDSDTADSESVEMTLTEKTEPERSFTPPLPAPGLHNFVSHPENLRPLNSGNTTDSALSGSSTSNTENTPEYCGLVTGSFCAPINIKYLTPGGTIVYSSPNTSPKFVTLPPAGSILFSSSTPPQSENSPPDSLLNGSTTPPHNSNSPSSGSFIYGSSSSPPRFGTFRPVDSVLLDSLPSSYSSDTIPDSVPPSSSPPPPLNPEGSPANVDCYSKYMREKIKLLPLPITLKRYLNLNREF